jgi:cystathionine beta-lyase/cystathionine gamma-synthase
MTTPRTSGTHSDTLAVHAAQSSPELLPSPPLTLNAAILLHSVEQGRQMLTDETVDNIAYQRYSNPTVEVLERKFAEVEGARHCLAFNSGMTACYGTFRAFLHHGDHVVAVHSLYHEISDQLKEDVEGCGVEYSLVDDYSMAGFERATKRNTKMAFVETPTNPSMLDLDIAALAGSCHQRGMLCVVDNTLLTHEYQKPLRLGADLTIYSTTKSINGHGDAMGGVVSTNDSALFSRLKGFRDNTGVIMDPFSAWLTVRGMRTLRLRLDKQTRNARCVVDFLQTSYPQLEVRHAERCSHASANGVAGNAGILSLVLDSKEQGTRFIQGLRLFRLATTFGNLESLVYHFGTFARPSRDITQIGVPLGLVRLSVGIEHVDDIIADIDQSLQGALTG